MKSNIEKILEKYSTQIGHELEVKKLSLMIFDELNILAGDFPELFENVGKFKPEERRYLEAAALLHDIGYYLGAKSHNKNSFELIINTKIEDFDDEQIKIVANIARYHRGAMPDKSKHESYALLKTKYRKTVKRLSAILRIADGLDRAHTGLIKSVSVKYDSKNNILTFFLTSNVDNYTPDISYAIRKKDLFEKVFKSQVLFSFINSEN